MTETTTYEHHFITNDGPIFNMIEDESGDIFWGYGHREGPEFIAEVNRWLVHTNAVSTVPDDLVPTSTRVDHLWATLENPGDECFALVEDPDEGDDVFPVTRLWL